MDFVSTILIFGELELEIRKIYSLQYQKYITLSNCSITKKNNRTALGIKKG